MAHSESVRQKLVRRWGRRALVIPPIVIGFLLIVILGGSRQPPSLANTEEPARLARVIEVPLVNLVPTATGYGPVQPAEVWSAIAQVSGRVVWRHPRLRNGEIHVAGTELLRIDPTDYELALASAQARLAELAVQEQNAEASLRIEERNLALADREFTRLTRLVKQGTTSQSNADNAERSLLNARMSVQNLKNTLALIPTQRKVLDAEVAQAQRNLENTLFTAPFDLRISNLTAEEFQFAGQGQRLFDGDGVSRVEIVAQFAMPQLRQLFAGAPDEDMDVRQLSERVAEFAGFYPVVRLDVGDHYVEWPGEFLRISDTVDPQTRTIGVVVAVDKPFEKARPGVRPPLSKGMFVQVLLKGRVQEGRTVVPRTAIRDGRVMGVGEGDRLHFRAVQVLFNQHGISVVGTGLQAGDRIVVSDLVPAVEGMLLKPQADPEALAELRAAAGDP